MSSENIMEVFMLHVQLQKCSLIVISPDCTFIVYEFCNGIVELALWTSVF